ncbi:MAG: hypothetical protein U1F98_06230 [Verrucomicrobiota bacterium]
MMMIAASPVPRAVIAADGIERGAMPVTSVTIRATELGPETRPKSC